MAGGVSSARAWKRTTDRMTNIGDGIHVDLSDGNIVLLYVGRNHTEGVQIDGVQIVLKPDVWWRLRKWVEAFTTIDSEGRALALDRERKP